MICLGKQIYSTIAVLPSCHSSTSINLAIGIFICFRVAVVQSDGRLRGASLFAVKFDTSIDCRSQNLSIRFSEDPGFKMTEKCTNEEGDLIWQFKTGWWAYEVLQLIGHSS